MTTPPLLESVIWTVFKEHITMSEEQVDCYLLYLDWSLIVSQNNYKSVCKGQDDEVSQDHLWRRGLRLWWWWHGGQLQVPNFFLTFWKLSRLNARFLNPGPPVLWVPEWSESRARTRHLSKYCYTNTSSTRCDFWRRLHITYPVYVYFNTSILHDSHILTNFPIILLMSVSNLIHLMFDCCITCIDIFMYLVWKKVSWPQFLLNKSSRAVTTFYKESNWCVTSLVYLMPQVGWVIIPLSYTHQHCASDDQYPGYIAAFSYTEARFSGAGAASLLHSVSVQSLIIK